jgi:hypothetical protein
LWRTVGADSTDLVPLTYVTGAVGGARLLRSLLRVAADGQRPPLVRLGALASVVPYLEPGDHCAARLLDTLRVQSRCWIDHPSYVSSSSIEPLLRDSIRAALRAIGSEGNAVGRAAGRLGFGYHESERWSATQADWCRRAGAAFGPALRTNSSSIMSDELAELARCPQTGPAALALAWRAVSADSAVLSRLIWSSAEVRDIRLYRTLLAVARDPKRPLDVRVAAVDAIAPLLHPALYWYQTARAQANQPGGCSVWGWASHEAVQEEGAAPMGPASRRSGVAELRRLGDEQLPPRVRDAARAVARCAAKLLDARTPEMW